MEEYYLTKAKKVCDDDEHRITTTGRCRQAADALSLVGTVSKVKNKKCAADPCLFPLRLSQGPTLA